MYHFFGFWLKGKKKYWLQKKFKRCAQVTTQWSFLILLKCHCFQRFWIKVKNKSKWWIPRIYHFAARVISKLWKNNLEIQINPQWSTETSALILKLFLRAANVRKLSNSIYHLKLRIGFPFFFFKRAIINLPAGVLWWCLYDCVNCFTTTELITHLETQMHYWGCKS